jgi:DNA processing protein
MSNNEGSDENKELFIQDNRLEADDETMSEREKVYWYWISKFEAFGSKTIGKLLSDFHSMEAVFFATEEELTTLDYITEETRKRLLADKSIEKLQDELRRLRLRDIHFITFQEKEFPQRLLDIYEAPYFLYYRGELPNGLIPSIAIIGARDCTAYGSELARYYAKELAQNGVQIISGLANGVDGQAHQGALDAKGKTFGVIGNGVDICYPKENYDLYEKLKVTGGILSEYPMKSQALAFHFPMRNRLIAGLSDGILVVEAREKSGSLITVDRGLEQGKDIYALPGRVNDALSKGCNNLIQNGAKLVQEPLDIIVELRSQYGKYFADFAQNHKTEVKDEEEAKISKKERKILSCLSLSPKHIEMIAIDTKLPIAEVMEALTMMEIAGRVIQTMAQCYVRRM